MSDVTHIKPNREHVSSSQTGSTNNQNEANQEMKNERMSASDGRARLTDSTVNSARVAEVQNAISNGDYTVDADSIANKMLSFEGFITT